MRRARRAGCVSGPLLLFRVLRAGKFVRCAVSGEAIALEELRYWSAEHQEAYASCEIATRRLLGHL